jgi:hypothetical protein
MTSISDTPIRIDQLNKGTRVSLRGGWLATLLDNCRRNSTRLADVEGIEREIGEISSSDILWALVDGTWRPTSGPRVVDLGQVRFDRALDKALR